MPVDGMCCSRFRFYGNLLGYSINNIRSEKTLVISLIHDIYLSPFYISKLSTSFFTILTIFSSAIIRGKKQKWHSVRRSLSSTFLQNFIRFRERCVNSKNITIMIQYKKIDWNNDTRSLVGVRSIEIFGRSFPICKRVTCYVEERERLQRIQRAIFWIMAIWTSKSQRSMVLMAQSSFSINKYVLRLNVYYC